MYLNSQIQQVVSTVSGPLVENLKNISKGSSFGTIKLESTLPPNCMLYSMTFSNCWFVQILNYILPMPSMDVVWTGLDLWTTQWDAISAYLYHLLWRTVHCALLILFRMWQNVKYIFSVLLVGTRYFGTRMCSLVSELSSTTYNIVSAENIIYSDKNYIH